MTQSRPACWVAEKSHWASQCDAVAKVCVRMSWSNLNHFTSHGAEQMTGKRIGQEPSDEQTRDVHEYYDRRAGRYAG